MTLTEIVEVILIGVATPAAAWLAWWGYKRESKRLDAMTERQRNEHRDDWMV